MEERKLYANEYYHIFNKSISNFNIFSNINDATRFLHALDYYNNKKLNIKLSRAISIESYEYSNLLYINENPFVKYIAYCVMPDHYHLLIKCLYDFEFSKFINIVQNSYSRYFNIKHNRKGPLWQSPYKFVRIENNEQLLHVSRYIHLNPTTSKLVELPENWLFSSYNDYINNQQILNQVLTEISIKTPLEYKKFVENNKDYQKTLRDIRKQMID